MAWHEAWEADIVFLGAQDLVGEVDLPSLKHLLADLCNAINERLAYKANTKISWKIVGNTTSQNPEPNDFKGMLVDSNLNPDTRGYYTLKQVLNQLLDAFASLLYNDVATEEFAGSLKDVGYFTSSTFATRWEWEDLIDAVGILTVEEVENIENWRLLDWWRTLRGAVEKLRYLELQVGLELGETTGKTSGMERALYVAEAALTRTQTWTADEVDYEDEDFANLLSVGWTSYVQYFRSGDGDWPWYDGLYAGGFLKAVSVPVKWDSDYLRGFSGDAMNLGFGAARSFAPPKETSLGVVAGFARGRREFEEFVTGPSRRWMVLELTGEAGLVEDYFLTSAPATSALILELDLAGAAFELDADSSIAWVELALDPDGDDVLTMLNEEPPAIVPADDYTVPSGGDGIDTQGSEHYARLEQLNVRFDLSSVFDYPA